MPPQTMMRMLSWRGAALLPVAALGLDRLRYLLAYGWRGGGVFAAEGHGYLIWLLPGLAALAMIALGVFSVRLLAAWRSGRGEGRAPASGLCLWGACAGALLAIHVVQEALEWVLIPGNDGLLGLLGPGSLWAALAAAATGALLALVLRGARSLISSVAARRRGSPRRPAGAPRAASPRSAIRRLPDPMARMTAGRGPPAGAGFAA